MYLFARRGRLAGTVGEAPVQWALAVGAKAQEISGHEVQLWANVYSEGFGTLTWTMWVPDLAAMEAASDAVQGDADYQALTALGATHLDGGVDDRLFTPVAGAPDPDRDVAYVSSVEAVCAAGSISRAMAAGVELAEQAEKITGLPTIFGRRLTGPYGSIGWLTGYADLAEFERAQDDLAAESTWVELLDGTEGCFVEDAAVTHQTLYRRLG